MRDPKRIEAILSELRKLWVRYPDQRLGQLLENYVFKRRGSCGCPLIFFQEDNETLERLRSAVK